MSVTTGGGEAVVSSETVSEQADDDDETRGERRGEARRASSGEETGAAGDEKPAKRRKSSSEKSDKEKRRKDKKKSGKRKEDEADLEAKKQKKKKAGDDAMTSAEKTVRFMEEEQRKESDDFWGDQIGGEAGDYEDSEKRDGRDSRDRSGKDVGENLMESAAKTVRLMEEEQRKESDDFWGEQTKDDRRESIDEAEDTTGKSRRKSKEQAIGGGSKKTKTVKVEDTIEMEDEYTGGQDEDQNKIGDTKKRKVSKKTTMTVTEEISTEVESGGQDDVADSKSSSKKSKQIKTKEAKAQAEEQQIHDADKGKEGEDFMDKVSKVVKSMHDEQVKESEEFWDDEGQHDDKETTTLKRVTKQGDGAEKASMRNVADEDFIDSVSKTVKSMVDEQDAESRAFWGHDSHDEDSTPERKGQTKKRAAETQDDDYTDGDQRAAKKKSGEESVDKKDSRTKIETTEETTESHAIRKEHDDGTEHLEKQTKKQDMESKSKEQSHTDTQRKDGTKKKVKKTVKTTYEEEISEVEDVWEGESKPGDEHPDKKKRGKRQEIKILHETKSDDARKGSVAELGDDDKLMKNVTETVLFMEEEQKKESDDFWGDGKDEDTHPSDIIRKKIEMSAKAADEEDTRHGVKHKLEDRSPTDSDDGADRVKAMKQETKPKDAMEADDDLPEGLTPEEVTGGPREAAMPDQTPEMKPFQSDLEGPPGAEAPAEGGPGPPVTLQSDSTMPPTEWSGDSVFSDQAAQLDAMRRQMQADSDAFWGQDGDECRVQEISSEPWEEDRPDRSALRQVSQPSGIVQEFESDDGGSEAAAAATGDSRQQQTHYQQVITTVIKGEYRRNGQSYAIHTVM